MRAGYPENSNVHMGDAFRVAGLVAGFIRQDLTVAEHQELDAWVTASDENLLLFEELTDEKNLEDSLEWCDRLSTGKVLKKASENMPFHSSKITISKLLRYAAAAILVLVAGGYAYFQSLPVNQKSDKGAMAALLFNDIYPGSDKAILILSDNSQIVLDGSNNKTITEKNGAVITKINGALSYKAGNPVAGKHFYNTLITPRGGKFQVLLPDGTRIWLNSASSIRYPIAFNGSQRNVEISGEAYFEVKTLFTKAASRLNKMPFNVYINAPTGHATSALVKVFGTHFNINAFGDDGLISTTLLEGSIGINALPKQKENKNTERRLVPGQQAQLDEDGNLKLVKAGLEEIMAWKNDSFLFVNAPIENIMNQVARWYDVQIVYERKITDHFYANISRNAPLSKLLQVLSKTNRIHFKVEGKKITVLP